MNEHQPDECGSTRLGENDTKPKYGHKSPLGPEKDLDAEGQQAEAERERELDPDLWSLRHDENFDLDSSDSDCCDSDSSEVPEEAAE